MVAFLAMIILLPLAHSHQPHPLLTRPEPVKARKPFLDRAAITKLLQADPHYFASLPQVPWSTDVHRHATGLATATLGRLWDTKPWYQTASSQKAAHRPHMERIDVEAATTQTPFGCLSEAKVWNAARDSFSLERCLW